MKKQEKKDGNIIGEVYAHIDNGGVTFKVIDEEGPCLVIKSGHFANNLHSQKIYGCKKMFKAIRKLMDKAIKHKKWSKKHPCQIDANDVSKE